MLTRYEHKKLTWIDLESPTPEEIQQIAHEFSINPLVTHELANPSLKPRVDLHTNFIYLILHFPSLRELRRNGHTTKEVDFVIGKHFLITTRYSEVESLHKFAKHFEVTSLLNRRSFGDHGGFLFFALIKEAYRSLHDDLDTLTTTLEGAQRRIFNGEEREMVKELSDISRDLLDVTRATRLHKEVLESFEVAGRKFFGEEFAYHLRSITGEYYRIEEMEKSNREFLNELRETNNSLLSTKQSEAMKILTLIASVVIPVSLIPQVFSTHAENMPLIGHPNDFWILLCLIVLAALLLTMYLRRKL